MKNSDNMKAAGGVFLVAIAIIAMIFVATMDSSQVISHYEVIRNTGNLTMRQFLAKRSVDLNTDSPKANEAYSIVVISSEPLSRSSVQDALWTADRGRIHFLFTNDTKLCQK